MLNLYISLLLQSMCPSSVHLQERSQEEIKKRHQAERDQLAAKLDSEGQRQEQDLAKTLDGQMEQTIREKKARHAAEEAARTDLSQDEVAAVSVHTIS